MKKLILPFLALLFLIACEKENIHDLTTEDQIHSDESITNRSKKRDVCHNGNIISISVNAIAAHQNHGDAVDMDGDGYFDIDNPCSETDCDDTTFNLENTCSCVEGEVEIDFDGPLFVAPVDEPGNYSWQAAIDKCNEKDTDGCDWFLPTKDQLDALYYAREDIGNFNQGSSTLRYYWSSTEINSNAAWAKDFALDAWGQDDKVFAGSCRCVRR